MAELDPEFSNATKNDEIGNDEDDTIAQLRDFAAKVDWASSDFSKPLHPARDHTKHDHSQRPKPAVETCLLYTSPSPRDGLLSRMPSSA